MTGELVSYELLLMILTVAVVADYVAADTVAVVADDVADTVAVVADK